MFFSSNFLKVYYDHLGLIFYFFTSFIQVKKKPLHVHKRIWFLTEKETYKFTNLLLQTHNYFFQRGKNVILINKV